METSLLCIIGDCVRLKSQIDAEHCKAAAEVQTSCITCLDMWFSMWMFNVVDAHSGLNDIYKI